MRQLTIFDKTAFRGKKQPILPPIRSSWRPPKELPDLRDHNGPIAIDTETYDPNLLTHGPGWATRTGHIVGFSVAISRKKRWYFPIRHEIGPNLRTEEVFAWARKNLSGRQPKIGANIMYDIGWFMAEDVQIGGKWIDVQHAEALLDETARSYALDKLAAKYGLPLKDSQAFTEWATAVYGKTKDQRANIYRCPSTLVGPYGEYDAVLALQIWKKQKPLLRAHGLETVFDLETRLLPVLIAMRFRGVRIDLKHTEKVRNKLWKMEQKAAKKLQHIVGFEVNVNAAAHLERVAIQLGLPIKRTAKGNASFTGNILRDYNHKAMRLVQDIRKYQKLRTTFIEGALLGKHVNGRVHTSFNPLRSDSGGTVSGRLSCVAQGTLIQTKTGLCPIELLRPGIDRVLTHKQRYRTVVYVCIRGKDTMYDVAFSNGQILRCTANHRFLTESGWRSLHEIMEKTTGTQQTVNRNSYPIVYGPATAQNNLCYCTRMRCFGKSCRYYYKNTSSKRNKKNACENKLRIKQNRRSKPYVRKNRNSTSQLQRRMPRRLWVFNKGMERQTCVCASYCDMQGARYEENTKRICCSPHRRKYDKQHIRESSVNDKCGTYSTTQNYTELYKGIAITKIVKKDVQTVYDCCIQDDASYVTAGVFNHNSSLPNLQNIPSRDPKLAPLLRRCFIPEHRDMRWWRGDSSQIEYRFLAHFAVGPGAKELRKQYQKDPNTDYHQAIIDEIQAITGLLLDRKPAKTINFGLIYGMGKPKLRATLGLKKKKAEKLFRAYHKGVPFAHATFEYYANMAETTGEVRTILGRRSRFNIYEPYDQDRDSPVFAYSIAQAQAMFGNQFRRAFTHKALNRVLQGSAADHMKTVMVACWEAGLFEELLPALTVHDELDGDFEPSKRHKKILREIKHVWETCLKIKVPILADFEYKKNWGEK